MDKFVCRKRHMKETDQDISDHDKQRKKHQHEELINERTASSTSHLDWKRFTGENLNVELYRFYDKVKADSVFRSLENECEWNSGKAAQVQIFGKWRDIPRKQTAYGDRGLSYTFSGNTVLAKPWTPLLEGIRDDLTKYTGHRFNFVLVNRYRNGMDHIGEHRDDEKDLVATSPIASLSFGETRDFVLKHAESRGKNAKRKMDPMKIKLHHGSLLMMNHPTNIFWYHSLPIRRNVLGPRINLTFRDFVHTGTNK